MKYNRSAVVVGALALCLLGVGTVQAMSKSLTKADEIKMKQAMVPVDAEQPTDLVAIFAVGFETELANAKAQYAKEYGANNFQVLKYNGYTLLVPPGIAEKALTDARAQVDSMALDQASSVPDATTQATQVETVREVFGVAGVLIYLPSLRAYADEKGFQYNFQDNELISKQVGLTSALHTKFEAAYPHLKSGITRTAVVSVDRARTSADLLVSKALSGDRTEGLMSKVQVVNFGDARVGFVYGNMEVHILVDLVTGDVINFNQVN
ncbi:MAG: hypothetical protein AAB776_03930 [Patescibacteria group bacterium]